MRNSLRRFAITLAGSLIVAAPTTTPAISFPIQENCWPNAVTIGLGAGHDFQLVRQAHVGWVRLTIPWRQVNPARGVWNFAGIERVVDAARSEGLQVLAILSTAPEWAGGGPLGNTPPADVSLWRAYVARTASHFEGRIAAYEIWNEPNLRDSDIVGVGWNRPLDSAPRYTRYLEVAAREINAAAPGTLVVGPVTSSEPNARTEVLFRQLQESGVSPLVDVISFHANGTDRTFAEVAGDVARSLELLSTLNPANANKPVWITEFGWYGKPTGRQEIGGENAQRDLIRRLLERMAGAYGCTAPIGFTFNSDNGWSEYAMTHAFIYTLFDTEGEPSGVYRANGDPKAVVADYLRDFAFPARVVREPWFVPVQRACSGLHCAFTAGSAEVGGDLEIRWAFGDGSGPQSAGATVTHAYPRPGRYFVSLGIEDAVSGLSLGGQTFLLRVRRSGTSSRDASARSAGRGLHPLFDSRDRVPQTR